MTLPAINYLVTETTTHNVTITLTSGLAERISENGEAPTREAMIAYFQQEPDVLDELLANATAGVPDAGTVVTDAAVVDRDWEWSSGS